MNRRRFVKKIGLGAGACVAAVAGLWAGKAERRSRPRMTTATEVAMGGEADAWREGAALEEHVLATQDERDRAESFIGHFCQDIGDVVPKGHCDFTPHTKGCIFELPGGYCIRYQYKVPEGMLLRRCWRNA